LAGNALSRRRPGVHTRPPNTKALRLFDLDRRAGEILRIQEQNGLPWEPIFGSPPPSTRAPFAFRLSRSATMFSTS
jgi:hypothetical protein